MKKTIRKKKKQVLLVLVFTRPPIIIIIKYCEVRYLYQINKFIETYNIFFILFLYVYHLNSNFIVFNIFKKKSRSRLVEKGFINIFALLVRI